ncbi:MAG: AAA family ATPase [Alphaproteobacteria bacterium 16-39-46]|nr:MAG: AAA family ATPase [Alphaproteobacteria bacterium 16-39-46]OZA43076.1 MAG: AAA family ATPase [Alphaproteobacteria bacterium 17-39-52]HQS84118.1 DUF4143 domain-containing protein [Alphaproteobacteria bacterium]HQS93992.1 DUF4143 domain-containing protein [Alphaproteobacteria bacterium]
MYKRILKIDLPKKQSAFLWGARKTGKSTYLKEHYPKSLFYDLLKSELFFAFSKSPFLFREEILSQTEDLLKYPVIIDEIQKIPSLLDEIHWLIENTSAHFILCGSSARKLRRVGVNLLGGRAWSYYFFPLVYPEITNFNLLKVFSHGTIPSHYDTSNYKKSLKSYINDYLTQEIQLESLVRNLPAFAKFLDSVGFTNGELVNYLNISRECAVDAKTVKEYYQILIDTLIGYYIYPFNKPSRRQLTTSMPKFYLFDVGVANALGKKRIETLRGTEAGKSFEQYIFLEMHAYKMMKESDHDITYWRTKNGIEVDFVIGNAEIGIEVKISDSISSQDLKGLVTFAEEYNPKKLYVVCQEARMRKTTHKDQEIHILNYQIFLEKLWKGEIFN